MRHVAIALTLLLLAAFGRAQGFTISDYDVDLVLQKSGQLDVTETIVADFTEPKHGIFRLIPFAYDNGNGATRKIRLTNISVTDEGGRRLQTKVSREGSNLRIRIGDPDRLVSLGPNTYVIHYSAYGELNWFDADKTWEPHVELYWNLTGNDWDVPIARLEFSIHFPEAPSREVRARVFAGPYGARAFQEMIGAHSRIAHAQTATEMSLGSSNLDGKVTRSLFPSEGATVVLDLPASIIHRPSALEELLMFATANLGLFIPLLALIVMSVAWLKNGKDPRRKPIAVQFEPPDNLTGSEAGTLIDERVNPRDISAGVFTLAVKGYLNIHPKESGLVFKKRTADLEVTGKNAQPDLGMFESYLLSKITSAGQMVDETDLRKFVAPAVPTMREKLYESLVARGYYLKNPDSVRTAWAVGGIFGCAALAFITAWADPMQAVWPSVVGGIVGAIIAVIFAQIMPRRTYRGAEAQRQTAGFEEFIRRAKGQELNWMDQKQPTMALFEEYLPHAIAFGLAEQWASAFEGILREMPSWYVSPYGTPFQPLYFGHDLSTIGDSIGSAAGIPPRSDGASGGGSGFSSGGGFSGGGFGGGGGGSW